MNIDLRDSCVTGAAALPSRLLTGDYDLCAGGPLDAPPWVPTGGMTTSSHKDVVMFYGEDLRPEGGVR